MTLDSIVREVREAAYTSAMGVTSGFIAGSATGFLATTLKISTTVSFANFGIAAAVGFGVNTLLQHVVSKIDLLKDQTTIQLLIKKIVVPIIAALAAIFVANYASMAIWTIGAVAVGGFAFAHVFNPDSKVREKFEGLFLQLKT